MVFGLERFQYPVQLMSDPHIKNAAFTQLLREALYDLLQREGTAKELLSAGVQGAKKKVPALELNMHKICI
ncbi:hypothetical protein P7K49_030279 [Saguinus oedipus]|uniref:Uncharacterized protein n=1 Tax=Saguinus oedipus TaxID=9490 RepID=A0ABQ9U1Q3_SAGOE|nr:hypothetical protein P7K49_030279 [Saguinus oedipus]